MKRAWSTTCTLSLAAVALLAGASLYAGESPYLGNWKLQNLGSGSPATYVLLQIEEKDGKLEPTVLSSPAFGNSVTIDHFQANNKLMQFDYSYRGAVSPFHVKVYAPAANAKTKDLLGFIRTSRAFMIARAVKTEDTKVSTKEAQNFNTPQTKALAAAKKIVDLKDQETALKELLDNDKYGTEPIAYQIRQALLQNNAKAGAKDSDLRDLADKFIAMGAAYGPEAKASSIASACQALARAEKVSPLAIVYARQAEKELTKDDSLAHTATVLKMLVSVLKKTGHGKEAGDVETRLAKVEEPLDAEFLKTAVPFKTEKYEGRKAQSKRVAVVELFTGAYCPPCVAADIAFDAALQTYQPQDVILLQYHAHVPAPDRLTNSDTEARYAYYKKNIRGVPTTFLNGTVTKGLGGYKMHGENSFTTLREAVEDALETKESAQLKLKVARTGEQIDIQAHVSNLKEPGENIKLRFVVIEEVVRYPGGNGQRLHHHVVRAMPGGPDGFPLAEASAKQSVSINVLDLTKSLDAYMTKFNLGPRPFLDDEYPLNIQHLKVVALIQDDMTKEILQAVQMDAPSGHDKQK